MSNPGKELGDETPVYVISVAAELAGMHPRAMSGGVFC